MRCNLKEAIEELRPEHNLDILLDLKKMARSTFYYHTKRLGQPDLKMVMTMLDKAFKKRDIHGDLIFHSDQGWHYQHKRYQKALEDRHITQSMSRKGNCLDNAMMENFFGLMKNELLYLQEWDSIDQFKTALRKYIRYYNNDRIKLSLKGKSPVQYRAR